MQHPQVLVVDDDASVRSAIALLLEQDGYRVLQAANGAEGLEIVRTQRPHAVVLDVMMPVLDGQGFMRALERERMAGQTRVVVTTGMQGIDDLRVLGDEVLAKPFRPDDLLGKVALATFRAGLARAGEPSTYLPAHTTSGGTVLVVDDDRGILGALEAILTDEGFSVVPLARCDRTLPHVARVLEPVAVIVDLSMPEVDGMTLLGWLRAEPALDRVPILMISGDAYALEAARDQITKFGAAMTAKPLSMNQILSFVHEPPASARRHETHP